ncbi:MAG TPA: ATP-binding protein [Thermoleophilaceae bacterium]|nr:ATP-binding protein [Thermoleophilaceae bacterium]
MRQSYRADACSVGHARHAVHAFTEELGWDPEAVRAVCLAVTEACANVVVHAYRDQQAPGEMVVVASEAEGGLEVHVIDHGMGLAPRVDSPGLGMGMPLMSQLSERFEVQTPFGGGTEVSMRFASPAGPRGQRITLAA